MNFKKETQKQKKKNYHLLRDHCLLGSVSGVVYLLVDLILKAILCGIYNTDITLVMLNMPCPWPSPRSSIVSCWCRGPETRQVQQQMSIWPQYAMGSAGARKVGGKYVFPFFERKSMLPHCLWEEVLAVVVPVVAICLAGTCSASWSKADTAAYAKLFCGGVSPAHFQDFCEKPKGCWLEQMR